MTDIVSQQIWTILTPAERDEACLAFWQGTDALTREGQPRMLQELAGALRFREVFVKRMPAAEKARHMRRLVDGPALRHYGNDILRSWLLARKTPMLACFVETQGLPHTDGIIHDGAAEPTLESLRKGIRTVRERFPPRDVALYMGIMLSTGGDFWSGLTEAVAAEFPDWETILTPSKA